VSVISNSNTLSATIKSVTRRKVSSFERAFLSLPSEHSNSNDPIERLIYQYSGTYKFINGCVKTLIINQGKSRNSIDEHLKHFLGSFLVRYDM
jgi:hypothetical protein